MVVVAMVMIVANFVALSAAPVVVLMSALIMMMLAVDMKTKSVMAVMEMKAKRLPDGGKKKEAG